MNESKNYYLTIGLGIILSFFAFTSAFIIKQAVYLPRETFNDQLKDIDSATSFDCWWTIWASNQAFQIKEKAVASDERNLEIISWQSGEKVLKVFTGEENASLRLTVFYYPHWKALINEIPTDVQRNEDGTIKIIIPHEESLIKLRFEEPAFVKTAFIVSAVTWLILVFGLFANFRKNFRTKLLTNNF
jgi:hypothetical protein